MTGVNWAKLIVAVTTIVCVTVLMAMHALTDAVGIPVVTTVLGYMLGNGVAAVRGEAVTPVVYRLPPPQPHADTPPL